MTRPYAFESHYNDYTFGGITEYGKDLWGGRDIVKATLQYKQDVHRENNEGEPRRTMSDQTLTVGLENVFHITSAFKVLSGFSFNHRGSIQAEDYNSRDNEISNYPSNKNNAYNIQGGIIYELDKEQIFNLSVARKARFATTKDRYSYRMGTAIPNPDLAAEYTINYELSYSGDFLDVLQLNAAAFYSDIQNTILSINNVQYDPATEIWLNQLQNAGASRYRGFELGVNYHLNLWSAGANYTYIEMKNETNPEIYFINVPSHKLFSFAQYNFIGKFSLQANVEYNSKRYSTSYGINAGGFTLFNTRIAVPLWKKITLECGVNNITDKNYTLVEGYPEAGRNYFTNLIFKY